MSCTTNSKAYPREIYRMGGFDLATPHVSIAIPASIIADVPGLQLKTFKIGQVARASAIYRVEEIFIYPDLIHGEQKNEMGLISQILRYVETPQYLRKRLFPLSPVLKYAGVLPPLNTLHHPTNSLVAALHDGEFREGVAIAQDRTGSLIDAGLGRPLRSLEKVPKGQRQSFRVRRKGEDDVQLDLVSRSEIPGYWGFRVTELQETLGTFMKRRTFDLYILTSRSGSPIKDVLKKLQEELKNSRKILVAFGSPKEGLEEILARESLDETTGDYSLNMIPNQGTQTVRTEEAIHATLAIINLIM